MKYFAAHEGSKPTAICKETHKSLVKSNLDLSRLERGKKKILGRIPRPQSLQGLPFLWEFNAN